MGGSGVSRCDLKENLLDEGCDVTAVEFPSSTLSIQEDAALSDKASGAADDITQIRPQKIHMTLRPGVLTFEMKKINENTPGAHVKWSVPWCRFHFSSCPLE